ncbi:hypothetical protein DFH09DRAFT_1168524 [Mycena vulgaris]|nr:hypothetical protein DFH09DRAFT_1236339 [Mycena vulgaris]KAJ6550881.1 hypothetical protein DFH09DRAFT_1168524 [Mycena vulgaris]
MGIAREEYRNLRADSILGGHAAAKENLTTPTPPCVPAPVPLYPTTSHLPQVTPLTRQAHKRADRAPVPVGARSLANAPASASNPSHRTSSSTFTASGRPLNAKTIAAVIPEPSIFTADPHSTCPKRVRSTSYTGANNVRFSGACKGKRAEPLILFSFSDTRPTVRFTRGRSKRASLKWKSPFPLQCYSYAHFLALTDFRHAEQGGEHGTW